MKTAIGCFIGLILSVSIDAESLLEGRVWLDSGEPVADAQVRLFDLTDLRRGAIAHVMTDGTGYFALPLAALPGRALPERFALGPNYPNPFNPSTIIPYQLAASAAVRLEVFNLLGQHIATLVDGERPAGFHTATWHATDGAGRAVGAGVYIYRMTVGVENQTGRMVLIDGQAGVSAVGAASVWSGVSGGEGAQVYGLIVSGSGLVPYVDPSFRVESGMAPVELVVSSGPHSAGKAADDDCAFCGFFGGLNDAQEEEEEETPEEEEETPEEEEETPEEEEEETEEEEEETDSTSSEGGPDLIVQSPSVSDSMLTSGQAFTLHTTVHNQGDEQAAATMLHYYRSNNATITASDTEVGTDAIGALAASDSSAVSIALTAPTGGASGVYYGACVASVSGESNTDNNCSSAVRITVSGQVATEDSTETETDPADSTATTQIDDTEGPEGSVQVDSTSVEVLDDTQRFNIQLVFAPDIIEEDRQVFQDAARRWEEVIIGDLSDEEITNSVGSEWMDQVIKENPVVDDLLVFVAYEKDLPYRWAFAIQRWNRTQGDNVNLCAVGEIQFSAEIRPYIIEHSGHLARPNVEIYNIALHEIGHLVGIGGWKALGRAAQTDHRSKFVRRRTKQ